MLFPFSTTRTDGRGATDSATQVHGSRFGRRSVRAAWTSAVAVPALLLAMVYGLAGAPADAGAASSGVAQAEKVVAEYSGPPKPLGAPGPALNAAKVARLRGKTVLYVPLTLAGPPFLETQAGLKAGLAAVGITMSTCDPNGVPSSVSSCFAQAKTDGDAAVVTGNIPYNLAPNAYKTLEAEHIPTLASVAGPGNPKSSKDLVFQIDSQQVQTVAQVIGDTAIADTGGKGHILFLTNTDTSSLVVQARDTIQTIKKECPKCVITNVPFQIANLAQIPTNVASAMVNNPSVNFILSQVDILLPTIQQGLQSSGKASTLKEVAATGSLSVLQGMAKSPLPVVGDVGLDFVYLGWVDADSVLRLLTGVSAPTNPDIPLRIFTPSNVQSLTLTPTQDIDTWYGIKNISKTFERLWGVK